MELYTTERSPARLRRESVKGDPLSVAVLQPLDDELIPIDIPLDKGLFGYRVASIQSRVAQVRDIAGLRQLRLGTVGEHDWGFHKDDDVICMNKTCELKLTLMNESRRSTQSRVGS